MDPITENPAASEWAAARGEKWRAQADGMEATLAPVDEPLIAALHLDRALKIADVGCGGGGTALKIARRAQAGTIVRGFDISPALIDLARSRVQSSERSVSFEVANMAAATPTDSYDRLVSRFAIMFFDDPAAAFANLRNWLAPNGQFAFAVWNQPAENPWFTTVRDVVADIIDLPKIDLDAPGPFRYGVAETLVALLDRAGFGRLEVRTWRGELPIGGGLPASEAAPFALASFSSFGEVLAKAADKARAQARRMLTARLLRAERNGAVWLPASVHLVTGSRT